MSIQLPLCGNGWNGFGCGKPIERVADLFRCADCKVPFHHWCLINHFADGQPREVEGYGTVVRHKAPHAFALEMTFLVSEIIKRDEEIAALKKQSAGPVTLPPLRERVEIDVSGLGILSGGDPPQVGVPDALKGRAFD